MQRAMTLNSENQLYEKKVSSLFETAETIQINALNQARRTLSPGERDMQLAKVLKRRDFLENFKHALAQEVAQVVAQVIAAYDYRVQAVYFIERPVNIHNKTEKALLSGNLTIQLLALVTSTSAALKAFVKSLD